jgi:hypothetical protein
MSEPIFDNNGDNTARNAQAEELAQVGAILGAAAIEAAKAAVLPPSVRVAEAAVGAAITFGALEGFGKAAEAVAKGAAGGAAAGAPQAVRAAAREVAKEVLSTPRDVKKHVTENPGTAIVEGLISPPLIILDAKLRKWFGK